jgi:hypothetical protein
MTSLSDSRGRSAKPVLETVDSGAENRPAMKARQPGEILFHDAGSTGWGRKRDLRCYKGAKSELDFRHLHGKFFDPAVDPDPDSAA